MFAFIWWEEREADVGQMVGYDEIISLEAQAVLAGTSHTY